MIATPAPTIDSEAERMRKHRILEAVRRYGYVTNRAVPVFDIVRATGIGVLALRPYIAALVRDGRLENHQGCYRTVETDRFYATVRPMPAIAPPCGVEPSRTYLRGGLLYFEFDS